MTCATSEIKCYFEQLDIFKCCFSFKDTINRMTPPLTFRRNIMKALFLLDDKLPLNSHVILVGLVQADFIYPAMAERLHPIGNVNLWVISTSYKYLPGSLHANVYYKDLYEWFNCMQIGPCTGWLNSNKTLRDIASKVISTLHCHVATNVYFRGRRN
jgi:acyloxyacyl hydrolase